MQRRTVAKIVVPVAIVGFFIAVVGVSNVAYALIPQNAAIGAALGALARAGTAQTPDEVIHYVLVAKAVLPERGSIFWWSPEKVRYESIQAELDDLISRAESITSLEPGNELSISEMYEMHARLRAIQETLLPF
jgi:hypothetical protein